MSVIGTDMSRPLARFLAGPSGRYDSNTFVRHAARIG
jgi:hypothetical protein